MLFLSRKTRRADGFGGTGRAGKTTLIRLAAGLMTADSGELTILGVDVAAHPQMIQDRIGYMPQKFGSTRT